MLLAKVAASGEMIGYGEAGITALLGYAVVFTGLISLMIVITIVGKIMSAPKKAKTTKAADPVKQNSLADAPKAEAPVAPGTAGELKLYDTPEREAAMIMAIVATQLNKPLNELRFISIKEVK